ncbi:MAG: C4-dicarboxylate ABC transporter substrate-binding protein, partial [Dehalococcoidia bacterium]|nr:C4-dicarboxylate ABC transporter substrate-binding protein [Dehalococcoidia bacterium]
MKKTMLMFFVLVGLVVLLIFGSCTPAPAPTPAPEVIELTCSNFFPPTDLHSILPNEWIKEIEKRTNGRVKITYYPGSSLVPADKTYDGVVTGICDIGLSCFAYTMGRFPVDTLLCLPHSYPYGWVATKVVNDFHKRFKLAEIEDVHVLYLHASSPQALFTTNKPVRKLEDLEGLVIRGTGAAAKILQALGAQGYGAPMSDVYELLAKGVVDGSFSGIGVLEGWRQAEVVKYVTQTYAVGST